jgi:hypothetical protein
MSRTLARIFLAAIVGTAFWTLLQLIRIAGIGREYDDD